MDGRTATILFTDMEGSTAFTATRGDRMAVTVMRAHERVVRDGSNAHQGRVVKSTGDGFLVLFPSPSAGVAAALQIRDALDAYNAAHPTAPLHVRMGLSTGPVIDDRHDVYGLAVTAAARVSAKARTGQVLVSEALRVGAGDDGDWSFVDRGLFWLKGIKEQWRLYEVSRGDVVEEPAVLAGATPFVGRDRERAALRRRVDEAGDGRGGIVVVAGEAGVGKSRLTEEVGAEADGRGMRFVVGRSYETTAEEPFAPFVEILDALERRMGPEAFRDALADAAPAIARIVPDLRRRYPDVPQHPDVPLHEDRRDLSASLRDALFVSVRDVLARVAAVRPLVILLDDLHWADEPSLRLLAHLAPALADLPVLVVATYTREETSADRPLHGVLAQLHRRRLVQTVHVGPFQEGDVGALLTAISGASPPASVVTALHEATGGNAFFLREVVDHLSDEGSLVDAHGSWLIQGDALVVDMPDSVRFTVEQRLRRVGAASRDALAAAAVIGRDFGFELLARIARLPEEGLLDAVDEAERARLLTSTVDAGVVRLAFSHELVRHALLADLTPARRQRLHLRVAQAIEELHEGAVAQHAAAIAYHLERAGDLADPRDSARFLLLAGERALEAAAFGEALRHLERAFVLVPGDDLPVRARVLQGMGTANRSLGRLDEALARWSEALDVYEAEGDNAAVARLCLDAAIQVAGWRRGREAQILVERGLRAIGDERNAHCAGLLALAGRIASQGGSYERGEELLAQALEVAEEEPDDRVLGLTHYCRAVHHFAYCEYPAVVEAGRDAVEYLRRSSDLWDLANALGYVGASLGWMGRFDEAAAVGEEGEALAHRLGNWSAYVFADQARCFRAIGQRGAPDMLERRGEQALRLSEELDFPWLAAVAHTRIGLAWFWRGDWEQALASFEESARAEVRGAGGGHLGRVFLVHAYLGHRSIALRMIDEASAQFPTPGRPASGTSWSLVASAAEALYVLGENRRVAELSETLDALTETGSLMRTWDFRLVATLRGMAAAARGEWAGSEQHFKVALRLARSLRTRLEESEACRFYAAMLLARDDPGDARRARTLLERAVEGYRSLEMARHEKLAAAMVGGNVASPT